jgi:hypothetical protein
MLLNLLRKEITVLGQFEIFSLSRRDIMSVEKITLWISLPRKGKTKNQIDHSFCPYRAN